ncbi:MAG: hypothetical protein GF333_01000 [Candidatus Omnitrophica bacterium]|nr:hypothetical protein [Candidatus Omnitrophota bacterium]
MGQVLLSLVKFILLFLFAFWLSSILFSFLHKLFFSRKPRSHPRKTRRPEKEEKIIDAEFEDIE